jgi:hypothetical protein
MYNVEMKLTSGSLLIYAAGPSGVFRSSLMFLSYGSTTTSQYVT